jgi:DNA polymerase eta
MWISMPSTHSVKWCGWAYQKTSLWLSSNGITPSLSLVAVSKESRQGLIAINYPSRKFGLSRHVNIAEAKKLCPNLIMQHVATWKEGEEKWAYHDDAAKNIATHKVSLDPYRLKSRQILSCIKDTLPAHLQKVEKASIDEVFMDLSAQVHSILLERYPQLSRPPPYDDPTECLPLPPTTALDWQADALVDLDVDETEEDDPDWDDVAILIGSEIVRDVRAAVRKQLKYTCSGGIAQNKMLAKLGSAHKKPNQQTVIRNRAVQMFLSDSKFTKIRGLGGKLGDQITSAFNTDTVKDLLEVPVEQLKQKLGDDTGTWVFQIIRGIDSSEVNSRTQIKSMLSAKSFRPSINTPEQAHRWLRIFAADIYSRLVEEGVLENKRRPKTLTLHFRHGGQMKSRQAPISLGKKIDETALFELAKNLLSQIILEGRVWPCSNISLGVGGFEDGIQGNLGIGAFLVKGEAAKATSSSARESSRTATGQERSEKRRRLEGTTGIQKFFGKPDSTGEHDDDFGAHGLLGNSPSAEAGSADRDEFEMAASPYINEATEFQQENNLLSAGTSALHQQQIADYICTRCNRAIEPANVDSHQDWHFAKDLQDEEKGQISHQLQATTTSKTNKKSGTNTNKKKTAREKPEKGQSKLAFG